MASNRPVHTRALIIGTGFSGLGMAIALQRDGIDFLILEKANDIGGTWRDNTYPGCACDIPSHMYSLSGGDQKGDWSHIWSPQPEIQEYLQNVTRKHNLRQFIRFGRKVERARWDSTEMRWHVFTDSGEEYVAQFVISGAGALHIPLVPDFKGRESFQGAAFHTAQWDHSVDLTGKRVAVIGTGASAIQVVPAIVEQVAELQLYQRTPAWVLPRVNSKFPEWMRWIMGHIPGPKRLLRDGIFWLHESVGYGMTRRPAILTVAKWLGEWNIRKHIADPELRRQLTPEYSAGCKRILNSSSYYWAINKPQTQLVTEGIDHITEHSIVTKDGATHEVDVIIYSTGFHVTDSYTYVTIEGENGENLGERWDNQGVQAHRGVTIAGMPNLFFLLGPNTGLGHNSVVFMIESEIHHIRQLIAVVDRSGAEAVAPKPEVQAAYNAELQQQLQRTVWNTGGCKSWYVDKFGNNTTLWSKTAWRYWKAMKFLHLDEFRLIGDPRSMFVK